MILETDRDFSVVTSASNGMGALSALRRYNVDVVVLDIEMPEMDGLTAIPHILNMKPRVGIIVASTLTTRGSRVAVEALAMGACDYVAKPSSLAPSTGLKEVSAELLRKVRALGRRCASKVNGAPSSMSLPAIQAPLQGYPRPRALAIGSSTGGPNALVALLSGLSGAVDLPILIVQHMPPIFTTMLAERLGRDMGRPCLEPRDGEPLKNGHVYLAPGDFHMVLRTGGSGPEIKLTQEAPENFCRPAVDPLFRSAAEALGAGVLGVVLTGMGEDGLHGCREVVRKGGRVLAQDEASSVVWGMPGAVVRAGLASEVLPIGAMAERIGSICQSGAS